MRKPTSQKLHSTVALLFLLLLSLIGLDQQAFSQSSCLPAPSGLVAFWKGEGNRLDSADTHDGLLTTEMNFAAGKVGQAFDFNGVYAHVRVPASPTLNVGTGSGFTFEAWIAPQNPAQQQNIAEWNNRSGYIGAHFTIAAPYLGGGPGSLWANLVDDKGAHHQLSTTTGLLSANVFQHVALTYDKASGVAQIYVNGVSVARTNMGTFTPYTASDFYLGYRPSGVFTGLAFQGLMDEVGLFDRALSGEEIKGIYEAGSLGKCAPQLPVRIASQPADQTVFEGQDATVSVVAGGTEPFSYQWFFNGMVVDQGPNASLVMTKAGTSHAGLYSVLVSNLYGSMMSRTATLSVVSLSTALFDDFDPDVDTNQWAGFGGMVFATNYGGVISGSNSLWFGGSASRFVKTRPLNTSSGGTIRFFIRLADGSFAPWDRPELPSEGVVLESTTNNGVNWYQLGRYDLPSYTNWTEVALTLPINAKAPVTQFRWRQLGYSTASLDNWALDDVLIALAPTPPVVVTQPKNIVGGIGSTVVFSATAAGTEPLSYQWRFNGTNLVDDARMLGATSNRLTLSDLQLTDAGTYDLVISNTNGVVTSTPAILTVMVPPVITRQPLSYSVPAGTKVVLSVEATGSPSPGYQWLKNGTNVADATSRELDLGQVQLADAGNYRVVVTNAAGAVTSVVATVTVLARPTIMAQPHDQTVFVGSTVVFNVVASGTPPLKYQWQFKGANLAGATASSLTLTNVQFSNAGAYSVVVSNSQGSQTSSNAVLVVHERGLCLAPPPGLVAWWQFESDYIDIVRTNTGMAIGSLAFGPGQVGQALSFNGFVTGLRIPASPSLDVGVGNGLTVEAWIQVNNPAQQQNIVEWNNGYGLVGTHFTVAVPWAGGGTGSLWANLVDTFGAPHSFSTAPGFLTTNGFQHVALTYDRASGIARIYVNGAIAAQENLGSFTPYTASDFFIGYRPSGAYGGLFFQGAMDEVSLYSRALSTNEIQAIYTAGAAGKCVSPTAPWIAQQPVGQSVTVGDSVSFKVVAGGANPLAYQWRLNGQRLVGATHATLNLAHVQMAQAGRYSVLITNVVGSVTSDEAVLTVSYPPAALRVASATARPGGEVILPVSLVANGNENALGFSLEFDPALLSFRDVMLGSGAVGATLLPNASQVASGRLGLAIALPTGTSLKAGTQELVRVIFTSAVVTEAKVANVTYGDKPVVRQLSDTPGQALAMTYSTGSVSLPAADLEGDVAPRPGGDRATTITDWVTVGRYVARLDYPSNWWEFQRADCAPRITLGDGMLGVTDWVQAGRYVAGLDAITPVGGSTSEVVNASTVLPNPRVDAHKAGASTARLVKVITPVVMEQQTATVEVALEAQGNENALAFSLAFDASQLTYTGASLASETAGATLNINATQAGLGQVGFVLALSVDGSFQAGSRQLVKASFQLASSQSASYSLSFADQPVPRGVSDSSANYLAAEYVAGMMIVNPVPTLRVAQSAQGLAVAWPAWATNYVLKESSDLSTPSANWNVVPVTSVNSNDETVVSLPVTTTHKFYRLERQ